jgi:anti-sigma factor RsiW
MNCRQLEHYAIEYLDGKLAPEKAAAVARHLAICSDCADRQRSFSDVGSLLDTWKPLEVSASFNARLQQRILADPAAQAGWLDRFSLWLQLYSFSKPAFAGALLGMMVIAVMLASYTPGTSVSITPPTASSVLVATTFEGNDELALFQDMPVLENLDLLSNFEVLQELQSTKQ